MPPKAPAQSTPVPGRPQTANDAALAQTEAALASAAKVEGKWSKRLAAAGEESQRTHSHAAILEACLQACAKLTQDLDRGVEKMVQARNEEPKEEKGGKKKDPAAGTPVPGGYRLVDINAMTDLLLKFYRFDTGKVRTASDPPSLVTTLKKMAKAAAAEVEPDPGLAKPAVMRGRSIAAFMDLSKVVLDRPDECPPSALPLPPAIDPGIWQTLLQFRSQRLQVAEAVLALEREKEPLLHRHTGVLSMTDVAQYALGAVANNKQLLQRTLATQESVRTSENAAWAEKQKAAPPKK